MILSSNTQEESHLLSHQPDTLRTFPENFCREALAAGEPDKKNYRVFLKRRCFVLICQYMMEHTTDPALRETVYSDVGMRVAAKKIAEDYWAFRQAHPEESRAQFPCRIWVFDDILIYGRSLNRMLSECEEIFADTYMALQKSDSIDLRHDLYDDFLSLVTIRTAFRNNSDYLLSSRYCQRLVRENNVYEPEQWRAFSYDIADSTFREATPNAAFIPALLFGDTPHTAEEADERFAACQAAGRLTGFVRDCSDYRKRRLYTYTHVYTDSDAVRFVLSIRCTKHYMIPFVFLPSLREEQTDRLMAAMAARWPAHPAVLQKKKEEWHHPYLQPVYVELMNLLLSVSLLNAFLQETAGAEERRFLLSNSTREMMTYNYAHDPEIQQLLTDWLHPERPAPFTLEELTALLRDVIGQQSAIFQGIADISTDTDSRPSAALKNKIERRVEKVFFAYGIYSEQKAYRSLHEPYFLHHQYVRLFPMPEKNNVGYFLQEIYSYRDSWSRQALPLNRAFEYLFQMMDAGCVAMTAGLNRDERVQSLKAGEQSINMLIYHYAEYLPLLHEVQQQCIRERKHTTEGLYETFNNFFKACRDYGEKNHLDISNIERIEKKRRYYLMYIVWKLYNAGQTCADYLYLVEQKLRDLGVSISCGEYIRSWKNLYENVTSKQDAQETL